MSRASRDAVPTRGRATVWWSTIHGDGRDSMAWDLAPASVLKLVLNRLVRTRMPGGVGGVPGQPGPLSRSMVRQVVAPNSPRVSTLR